MSSISSENIRKVLESVALGRAEALLATSGVTDDLQKMIENLNKMQVSEIPAIVERLKMEYGFETAMKYEAALNAALDGAMAGIKDAKNVASMQVAILSGDIPASDMEKDVTVNVNKDIDVNVAEPEVKDDFAGDDVVAGPEDEPLGRARKDESMNETANEFTKGQKVKHKGKNVTVEVPNGPGDLVGVKVDGKVKMVPKNEIGLMESKVVVDSQDWKRIEKLLPNYIQKGDFSIALGDICKSVSDLVAVSPTETPKMSNLQGEFAKEVKQIIEEILDSDLHVREHQVLQHLSQLVIQIVFDYYDVVFPKYGELFKKVRESVAPAQVAKAVNEGLSKDEMIEELVVAIENLDHDGYLYATELMGITDFEREATSEELESTLAQMGQHQLEDMHAIVLGIQTEGTKKVCESMTHKQMVHKIGRLLTRLQPDEMLSVIEELGLLADDEITLDSTQPELIASVVTKLHQDYDSPVRLQNIIRDLESLSESVDVVASMIKQHDDMKKRLQADQKAGKKISPKDAMEFRELGRKIQRMRPKGKLGNVVEVCVTTKKGKTGKKTFATINEAKTWLLENHKSIAKVISVK